MAAMQKQFVISLCDLRYVCIECPHCKAVVTLDMKETSEFQSKQGVFAPKECPGCRKAYDTAIPPNVDSFQRSYKALLEIAERVSFRGKAEEI